MTVGNLLIVLHLEHLISCGPYENSNITLQVKHITLYFLTGGTLSAINISPSGRFTKKCLSFIVIALFCIYYYSIFFIINDIYIFKFNYYKNIMFK